jgi:hypothetical protein
MGFKPTVHFVQILARHRKRGGALLNDAVPDVFDEFNALGDGQVPEG